VSLCAERRRFKHRPARQAEAAFAVLDQAVADIVFDHLSGKALEHAAAAERRRRRFAALEAVAPIQCAPRQRQRVALDQRRQRQLRHRVPRGRQHDGIQKRETGHEIGAFAGREQTHRGAHRMARERHRRSEMFEYGNQVVDVAAPRRVAEHTRRQLGAPMPARVERLHMKAIPQRLQQRAISARVETGGVQKDDVGRGRRRAERDAGDASAWDVVRYAAKGFGWHGGARLYGSKSVRQEGSAIVTYALASLLP